MLQEMYNNGWMVPLTEVTADRRTARTGLMPGAAWHLSGVDLSSPGGIRPHGGLKFVRQLGAGTTVQQGDVRPFTIRVGADKTVSGFVYRTRTGSTAAIAVDWYDTANSTWYSQVLTSYSTTIASGQIDVVEFGRFIYVFRRGGEPLFFYMGDSGTSMVVRSNTGPGPRPPCKAPDRADPLGGLTTGETSAQVVLTRTPPSQLGVWPGTPPQADEDVRPLEPGDYVFGVQFYNSQNGRKSSISEIVPAQYVNFASEVPVVTAGGGSGSGSGTGTTLEVQYLDRYAYIEMRWDSSLYDQAIIYRSVKTQSAGGTFVASILLQEAIITLAGYLGGEGTTASPTLNRAIYCYSLQDKELVFTDLYSDRALFDEEMPKGGAALSYEGTMLVSSISGTVAPQNSVGEIRWSGLLEVSPELFPPSNRYVPRRAADEVKRFVGLGANVVGFSSSKVYLVRKEGGYIKIYEMHEGFGVVDPRACTAIGSFVYFVTDNGLKAVDSQGALDDIRALNNLIVDEWKASRASMSLAYDAALGVLVVFNSTEEEAALMWLNTSGVSFLEDMRLLGVEQGRLPTSPSTTDRAFFYDAYRRVYVLDNRQKTVSGALASGANGQKRIGTFDLVSGDSHFTVLSAVVIDPDTVPAHVSVSVTGGTIPSSVYTQGTYVYVVSPQAKYGKRALVVSSGVSSLTVEPESGLTLEAGDRLVLSPLVMRWTGSQVGLVTSEGAAFASAFDNFRSRHITGIRCSFSDVTVPVGHQISAVYEAGVYRDNDALPTVTALPTNPQTRLPELSIVEGAARLAAVFAGPANALAGSYGISGPTLYPSIRVLVADLDFRLLGVRIDGNIEGTERTGRSVTST